MWFSIRQKILATFGVIVLLVVGLGLYQLEMLRSVHDLNERIVADDLAILNEVNQLTVLQQKAQSAADRLRDLSLLAALGNQSADRAAVLRDWEETSAEFGRVIDGLRTRLQNALDAGSSADLDLRVRQLVYELAGAVHLSQQIEPIMRLQFSALDTNDFAEAEDRHLEAMALRDQLTDKLASVQNIVVQFVAEGNSSIESAYGKATVALIVAVAGIVLVGSLATWLLQRSISRPLQQFARFVEKVGSGDLTQEVALAGRDEITTLGRHLNEMVVGLRELASQSRGVADSLNTATVEIHASTQQQAASVEEQLASIQETSATLDEITQSGAQISRRAQELSEGSEHTLRASDNGLQAVESTVLLVEAIREQAESVAENIVMLSEKTQAVGDIIATVNDISERSHILALNAAIEAAAAGEHGRSFAVVAAEIKNLADQSKEATVQVRAVLGDIQRGINTSVMLTEEAVKRVASGKQQTDLSQRAINDLTDSIQESTDTFQQIVAAINQQHIGLEQVMIALRNIRQASTQTADSTRQLDGAAAHLSALSTQLSQSIGRYGV